MRVPSLCFYEDILKKYGTSAGSYTITINRAPISDPSCSYGQYYNGKKINTSNGLNIDTPDGSYILSTCTYNNEKVYSTTSAKNPGTYYIYWTVDDNHCWNNGYPDDSSKWTTGIKRDYWTIKGLGSSSSGYYVGYYIDSDGDGKVDGIIYEDNGSNTTNYYLTSETCYGNSNTTHSNVVKVINYKLNTNRFKFILLNSACTTNAIKNTDTFTGATDSSTALTNDGIMAGVQGSAPTLDDLRAIRTAFDSKGTKHSTYYSFSSGAKWYFSNGSTTIKYFSVNKDGRTTGNYFMYYCYYESTSSATHTCTEHAGLKEELTLLIGQQ